MVKNEKTFNCPIWKRYLGMKEDKRILIVSYKLGTEYGVGGRRWLYYGLELLRQEYNIFFLTYQKSIPNELSNDRDRVFHVEGNYPQILNTIPKGIIEKFKYKFWLWYLKRVNKGATFDEAKRTKKQFISSIEKIINDKKITHLIISGAPFSLMYFGTLIKNKFPNIKLISDYRDAWTNGVGYGMPELTKEKFEEEVFFENEVLKRSDTILVASKDIEISVKQIVPEIKPIILLNFVNNYQFNGESIEKTKTVKDNNIYITHIGSVNRGTAKYWQHHFHLVQQFNATHEMKIISKFIGDKNQDVKQFVISNNIEHVNFLSNQKSSELSNSLSNSDVLMMFKNDVLSHSFATKFFDYIYFRKPMLCYGIGGTVTDEIEQNNLGVVFDHKTTQQQFDDDIIQLFCRKKFNDKYNYEKFSLLNLTSVLIEDVLN